MNKPEISIVIPTYNRRASLAKVLDALALQTLAPERFEVVVVSDGSSDGTNEFLAALALPSESGQRTADSGPRSPLRISTLIQENQGVAVARNHGIQAAQADLILFLDDDVIPSPQLVAEHLAYPDRDAIVLGPMLTPRDTRLAPWVLWEQRMLEKQYRDMLAGRWQPTARQFYTGNTSLYKRYLEQAGGFDPTFRRAEDVELAYRLKDQGCRFEFNPRAEAYHYAWRSFASWKNSASAYGRNDVIMTREKGQTWLLPTIFNEYRGRNALIRGLTWLCLDRPLLAQLATGVLLGAARTASALGNESISRISYSGIFNYRYYQGLADALGGRAAFWREALSAIRYPLSAPDVEKRSSDSGALPSESGPRKTESGARSSNFLADLRRWILPGHVSTQERISIGQVLKMLWRYRALRATSWFRLASWFKHRRVPFFPNFLQQMIFRNYGLEIPSGANIGGGLYIAHPVGTVIMPNAIGRNCSIISNVTIGMRKEYAFPLLGDDVFIGAGARVLGGIRIGNGAVIGANAVVLRDVPDGATAVGVPARVIPAADLSPSDTPAVAAPGPLPSESGSRTADSGQRSPDSGQGDH